MPTEVQFYHLLTTPLARALPKLMEKAYAGGYRSVITTDSAEHALVLDTQLWDYDAASFLPHGVGGKDIDNQQPILISTTESPANAANLLCVTDGRMPEDPQKYSRILDIFDGNDDSMTQAARERWKSYKEFDITVSYHKQTEAGGWQKK